ncbi:AMP-binding protein [Marinospirillum perlucidum]|uniref:AMP-binding protein n=1 Tax=Marinospirillum perlucidum TaxID=1982602 RepID=UPI000DF3B88E|nr:AMP-binding protein [Marinospirillum perlucidum]
MASMDLSRNSLLEIIKSLVADELSQLRKSQPRQLLTEDWDAQTCFYRQRDAGYCTTLEADSLEILALGSRVAQFFQIHESGLEDYLLRYNSLGQWAEVIATARKRGSRHLTFTTSGSSGQPQASEHDWDQLIGEIQFFDSLFTALLQQPLKRVVALAPCHHIYGFLFSVLLPEYLGCPVIRGQEALALASTSQLEAGDLIVGFPFAWQQLARTSSRFPDGLLGLTSTGPCAPEVFHQLQSQGLQMMEIYGATETAGVGFRSDPQAPYRLLPRWQPCTRDTHLLLDIQRHQRYPLQDELEWVDQRHFYPCGRLDQAVQVGGINVYPQRIARLLESLPEVHEARVRLMTAAEGDRLKAFIVPAAADTRITELQERLESWCLEALQNEERPKAFTFGVALPSSSLGKELDWPLE